ncbi:outer membrane protein assembly factor BamB family protein [Micromonospora musae]|uniref:outer membrane protein assembly factor BamB family protein n=1 Tax=Micromonospora musae TaxID=1894970 RepID=UPI0013158938|nr:PQQ-binding-like beta-propeller repeat protein [Micromonospora musae]
MESVIELGAERGAPQTERRTSPTSRWWPVSALLLLCALLGGAAPPAGLTAVAGPMLPERSVVLGGGASLLVVEPGADRPSMTAYDPATPNGPPRWRVSVPPAAGWSAEPAGGLLLVTERDATRRAVGTTARSAETGAPRWRRTDRVYPAGDGAVAVTEVRSVSDPGRRIEGAVRGVDPATGATRWTVPLPSTAVLAVLPGTPGAVLVVRDDGLARVYDVRDATVRGEGRLPPADYAPGNPQVVGDRLVLRHPTAGGGELVGYDLPGLTARWRAPIDGGEVTTRACQGLLCAQDGRDRWALDPVTGERVWTWPGGAAWTVVPGGRDDSGPPLLLRPIEDGRRELVARAGRDGPVVVGVLPVGVRDCRAVAGALACRTPGGRLTVWAVYGSIRPARIA